MVLESVEFEELMEEITHRLSVANIDGSLQDIIAKLGWETLLPNQAEPLFTFKRGKILVIGEQTVETEILRMTANRLGLDSNRFEFQLGYEAAKTYNYAKLAYNTNYRVILIGATPHSTTGTGNSGSLLAELQNHPDKYPRTCDLRTGDGTLKITKTNFKQTLQKLLEEDYIVA